MGRKKKKTVQPVKIPNNKIINTNPIKKAIRKNALCNKGLQLIKSSHKSKFNMVTRSQHNKQISASLNYSVITISDNENENENENVKYATQNNNENKIVHSSIGQLCKSFNHLRKASKCTISNLIANNIENSKLKNKRNIELSNNDKSCYIVPESTNCKFNFLHTNSGNEESSNNTLNESLDDVVVVWSSINNPSTIKPTSDKTKKEDNISNEENLSRLFMIDYSGDSNNLTCLKSTIEEEEKEKEEEKNKNNENNKNKLLFNEPGLRLPNSIRPNYSITVKPQKKYKKQRGHTVKVFVPQHKRSLSHPLLEKLWKKGIIVFTPSRNIGGKNITPYDDRFILEYATICKGIVVSSDQYRDLYHEKPEWHDTIENRLLAPTFVGKYVLFPDDPLGRNGPTLAQFLRHD
ncbi:hypothetical protein M0802_003173 [Mischocyttarus mexicanus]|nr:hypothetical protein M0802_003173 [Mischocyttarus mexicanus]